MAIEDINEVLRSFAAPVAYRADGVTPVGAESDYSDLRAAAEEEKKRKEALAQINPETQLANIAAALSKRGSAATVSRSPTGTIEFSNVGERTAQPSTGLPPAMQTGRLQGSIAAPSVSDYYQKFQTRKQEIAGIQDIEEQANALTSFKGEVAQHIADSVREISSTAESMFGVPQLEALLKEREAADRAHPLWSLYLTDTPMTAQTRTDLLQARANARAKAADLMNQSPELMKLQNEADMFFQKEGQMLGYRANKEAAQDQKDTLAIAQAGPNGVAVAKAMNPSLQSDADAANFFNANKSDKDMVKVADNWENPAGLLSIALTSESGKALSAIATKQAIGKAGTDPIQLQAQKDAAMGELMRIRERMQDPAQKELALKALIPDAKERKRQTDQLAQDVLMKVDGAEERLKALDVRAAAKLLSMENTAKIISSIDNWDSATKQNLLKDVDMAEIVNTARTASMPLSLDVLAAQINKIQDPARKMVLLDKLRNYALSTASFHSQGVYGQVSTFEINAVIDKQKAAAAASKIPGLAGLLIDAGGALIDRAAEQYKENVVDPLLSPLFGTMQTLTTPLSSSKPAPSSSGAVKRPPSQGE